MEEDSHHHPVAQLCEKIDPSLEQLGLVYRSQRGWGKGQGLKSPTGLSGASAQLPAYSQVLSLGILFTDMMFNKAWVSQYSSVLEGRHWSLGSAFNSVRKEANEEGKGYNVLGQY